MIKLKIFLKLQFQQNLQTMPAVSATMFAITSAIFAMSAVSAIMSAISASNFLIGADFQLYQALGCNFR